MVRAASLCMHCLAAAVATSRRQAVAPPALPTRRAWGLGRVLIHVLCRPALAGQRCSPPETAPCGHCGTPERSLHSARRRRPAAAGFLWLTPRVLLPVLSFLLLEQKLRERGRERVPPK